jgi:hypothetical protein
MSGVKSDPSELIQLEKDWDRATATYEFIFIPNKKPIKRRHKNQWTDADPDEINRMSKYSFKLTLLTLSWLSH